MVNANIGHDRVIVHDDVMQLMPWYVNGTLDEAEYKLVKSHMSDCERCQAELVRCQDIEAATLHHRETAWSEKPGSLDRLLDQIDELEAPAANEATSGWHRVATFAGNVREWLVGETQVQRFGIVLPSIIAVALVSGLGLRALSTPTETAAYKTVTDVVEGGAALHRAQLIFTPETTTSELADILSAANASIVDGPNAAGRFTVSLVVQSEAEKHEAVAALRARPQVMFAEPE